MEVTEASSSEEDVFEEEEEDDDDDDDDDVVVVVVVEWLDPASARSISTSRSMPVREPPSPAAISTFERQRALSEHGYVRVCSAFMYLVFSFGGDFARPKTTTATNNEQAVWQWSEADESESLSAFRAVN